MKTHKTIKGYKMNIINNKKTPTGDENPKNWITSLIALINK